MKENMWKCSGELLGHFIRPFKIQREGIQYQKRLLFYWEHCCSVTKSCPTLCDPWTAACQASLSFSISWSLLKLTSIELVKPSNHRCHPPFLLSSVFPSIRPFPMNQLFASGGQSIGASALASVLPMNIQDWFPLGWTGLISFQSKGLSRVFSPALQFESINPLALSLFYGPTLTSIHDYWKKL